MKRLAVNFILQVFFSAVLGAVTALIIFLGTLLIPTPGSLINYLMYLVITIAVLLLSYFLLTRNKIYWHKSVPFFAGMALIIWMISRNVYTDSVLYKYFVLSLIVVFVLATTKKILVSTYYLLKNNVKISKKGIVWGWNINTVPALDTMDMNAPLQSMEKIKRIRSNVGDDNLFASFEGKLIQIKNAILNKKNIKFNRIFCINGSWGSGKTGLIKLLREALSKVLNKDKKYQEPIWLDFNPWLYNNQDELVKDFFADLKQKTYENWYIDLEPEISSITKTITPSFEGMGLKIPFFDLLPKIFTFPKISRSTQDSLNKKLENIDRPFIVVFDDVDRPCEIQEIILIVKLISLLTNLNNIIVIAAFDYKRVSKLISKQTNDAGQKFLEKFIHKTYTIPPYEYKELESIFISDSLDSGKLSSNLIDSSKRIFQEFVWSANRQWFRISESQKDKSDNIVLDPLYERYKDLYLDLSPGGNYPLDYKNTISPILKNSIADLINGSIHDMASLVRSFVKPIQKIKRARIWEDYSSQLKNDLSQFNISATEERYTHMHSFLLEREDLYGQILFDQIANLFLQLEQAYPIVVDNEHRGVYEHIKNTFLERVQDYVNRYEDVKDEDYIKVVNWLIEPMTPRDVVKFALNVEEELVDWNDLDAGERVVENSTKEIYQY